jgi:hypothetical protein
VDSNQPYMHGTPWEGRGPVPRGSGVLGEYPLSDGSDWETTDSGQATGGRIHNAFSLATRQLTALPSR